MAQVHFITPTDLPLDAFTNFGGNHKPNSANPIGYFGTGLKYVVAIVARHGGTVTLTTPKGAFVFYGSDMDFRGKTFTGLRMKRRTGFASKWRYEQMPFTTELGKNWHLWQAFRELLSNTLDEGGIVTTDDHYEHGWSQFSRITIDCEGFDRWCDPTHSEEVWLDRGLWAEPNKVIGDVEVWDAPAICVYYKGIRVYDFPEGYKSRRTYNFTGGIELSEDRTVRNQWTMQTALINTLDQMDARTVAEVLRYTPGDNGWESAYLPLRLSEETTDPSRGNIARGLLVGKSQGYSFGYYATTALKSIETTPMDGEHTVSITLKNGQWRDALNAMATAKAGGEPDNDQVEAFNALYDALIDDIHGSCDHAGVVLKGLHDDYPEEDYEG